MKFPVSIILTFCLTSLAASSVNAAEPITISIAAPVSGPGDPERTIIVDKEDHFDVIITNISDHVQKIVTEGNSTGDIALSFEITDAAGKQSIVHRRMRFYTKNMLHWWVLQPGEHVVLDVAPLDKEWSPAFPHPPRYGDSQTVTMSAVFEVEAKYADGKEGLWSGRVVSEPMKYVFSSRISDAP